MSTITRRIPAIRIAGAEAPPRQLHWGEANRLLLERAGTRPALLDPASFGNLAADNPLPVYGMHPWPLFVGPAQSAELARTAEGIDRVFRSVPERFFGNDPAKIARAYHRGHSEELDDFYFMELTEEMAALLLEPPSGLEEAPSRADYLETEDGLKCIEFNGGGSLGGLQMERAWPMYEANPEIAAFLREEGITAGVHPTMTTLFLHIVEEAVRSGVWEGDELNVAVITRPHNADQIVHSCEAQYNEALHEAMRIDGRVSRGEAWMVGTEELQEDGEGLTCRGKRVHAVFEQHDGQAEIRLVFRYAKAGLVNYYSGPIQWILSDKRALAVVSEHADSDVFTAEERGIIERHLPWTRHMADVHTKRGGERHFLPQLVAEHPADFVLKKATSVGGYHVHVGRFADPARWAHLVGQSVREGDWIVQDYMEPVGYRYPDWNGGLTRWAVAWGLFVFGGRYGGAFLRMEATGRSGAEGRGVLNVSQGARVGLLVETDR